VHGTCEDGGPNTFICNCEPGWGGLRCEADENECLEGTHACAGAAVCSNNIGSHTCACLNNYWGNGRTCTPCTECSPGYKAIGVCLDTDYTCVNVDECTEGVDNCHAEAACTDTEGSFRCECRQNGRQPDGSPDEWWGMGVGEHNDYNGCQECTQCYDGYHELQPCVSTSDRTCMINVSTGLYMLETEADDNKQCLAMMRGEWYPSRLNFGNGEDYCGMAGKDAAAKKDALVLDGQAIFKLKHIGNRNDQRAKAGGDMYTLEFSTPQGYSCLFFGNHGKDIYPSLQNCHAYPLDQKDNCPWNNPGEEFCGYVEDDVDSKTALMENGQAIWRVTPLKLNANKYILQTASKGRMNADNSAKIWECLAFEEQGAATNPSRYNWGNGDDWCGAGDWQGLGPAYGLLNNKQAVFILTFMQATEDTDPSDISRHFAGGESATARGV